MEYLQENHIRSILTSIAKCVWYFLCFHLIIYIPFILVYYTDLMSWGDGTFLATTRFWTDNAFRVGVMVFSLSCIAILIFVLRGYTDIGNVQLKGSRKWQIYTIMTFAPLIILFFILMMNHFTHTNLGICKDIPPKETLAIINSVLIGTIVDEMLFRGAILRELLNINSVKPWIMIVISAVLFALDPHDNIIEGYYAFLIGLLTGWIYYETRSLLLCFWIRLSNNLWIYLFSFLTIPLSV